jgi:phosphatidate cytidylyltransferase
MKALKRDRGIPNWGKQAAWASRAPAACSTVWMRCASRAPIFFHAVRWYFNA